MNAQGVSLPMACNAEMDSDPKTSGLENAWMDDIP